MLAMFNPSHSSALIAHLEATFADDATKNGFMPHSAEAPLMRGSPCFEGQLGQFVQCILGEIKTTRLLEAHKPSAVFNVMTRTNWLAPRHSSLLKTLWAAYGPDQLKKKSGKLMRKIELGGFAESPPMMERTPPPSGLRSYQWSRCFSRCSPFS